MARVLYWNIQQFGINKINQIGRKRDHNGNRLRTPESGYRRDVIRTTLTQNTPDIFVVVETSTGGGAPGTLISAGGSTGSRYLLGLIRNWLGANWMLVPPVRLGLNGVTEGISVYYNSANLEFTGPWGWQGGGNASDSVANIGAMNLVNYAHPWNTTLPLGNVNANSNINANRAFRQLAGQWQFRGPGVGMAPGPVLGFPNNFNRTPYLTTFWDNANNRTIKLMSFHASPKKNQAANGTDQLSNIQEMTANLAANEVGVIVGDFNVDVFNTHFEPIAYNNLTGAAGYTRAINPTANQWPDKGYVCTMLRSHRSAKPWDTNGYSGYEYVIKDSFSSVDNILTRYGVNAGGPAANITIANRVTGAPYNLDPNPPVGVPAGHYTYRTGMAQIPIGMANAGSPVALPLPPNGPNGVGGYAPGNIGALSRFKGWDNFRRIRSTSDHMALIIDI